VGQGSKASAKKGRVDGAFREANGDDEFWGTEDGGGHDMWRSGRMTAAEEEDMTMVVDRG
jgi:hypothetical protein